jgi:hypothetical protein
VARPTAPAAFVFKIPPARPEIARLVVVAPLETLRLDVEATERTLKILVVALPEMTRSFAKVYVPAPPKVPGVVVITPVPELYAMTEAPESDEEEILLLKLVQSAVERQPKVAEDALLQVRVPLVVLSPAPIALKEDPLSVMRLVLRPFVVEVPETKSTEVVATPVVVEFVNDAPAPVTFPDALTFVALMFAPVMLPAESAPVNDDVALPVTFKLVVVAVPLTTKFDVEAVPVAVKFAEVALPEKYTSPFTSSRARVEVADAPIKNCAVVVLRR